MDWAATLPISDEFGAPYLTGGGLLAVDLFSQPAIDTEKLTVRMRISTEAIDRERMIILQDGIDPEYYVGNPVVLYAHGDKEVSLPVAMSEYPDGRLAIIKSGKETYGVAHHIADDKLSMQFFHAVEKRLLRASSIGLTPKPGGVVARTIEGERMPVVVGAWLNEWSYCAVPVNPEAIIKSMRAPKRLVDLVLQESELQSVRASEILSVNKLDGSPIVEPLARIIKSLIPNKKPIVEGFAVKRILTKAQIKAMCKRDLVKALGEKSEYDEETGELLDSEAEERMEGGSEGEGDEPEVSPPGEQVDQSEAPGSIAVRTGFDVLAAALDNFRAAMVKVELPEYKDAVSKELDKIGESLMAIAGAHDSQYPSAPPLGSVGDSNQELLKSLGALTEREKVSVNHIAKSLKHHSESVRKGQFEPTRMSSLMAGFGDALSGLLKKAQDASSGFVPKEKYESDIAKAVAEANAWKKKAGALVEVLEKLDSTPEPVGR